MKIKIRQVVVIATMNPRLVVGGDELHRSMSQRHSVTPSGFEVHPISAVWGPQE
jgi:hypothetical protein